MPCSASSCAAWRLRLLQNRREDVAGLRLLPLRALDVQHRGLQHAAERRRLLGLALLAARQLLDRLVEVGAEIAPQPGQIGAAGARGSARRRYRAPARRADARASRGQRRVVDVGAEQLNRSRR